MLKNALVDTIKHYSMAFLSITIAIALFAISLINLTLEPVWIFTLWGCLILSLLGVIVQLVVIEKKIKNYSSQLLASKERLTNEIKHRLWAEKTTSEIKVKSQFIDENIPVMLAYFNTDQRCRYHNRIFRSWFGLKPDQIDGHLLQEFTNEEFFSGMKSFMPEVIAGKTIHNERTLKSIKGFPYIFSEQYLPHIDGKGNILGFFILITPRSYEKCRASVKNSSSVSVENNELITANSITKQETKDSKLNEQSYQSDITAARILQAIDGGEFNLYCQKIVPIALNSSSLVHQEILIRMAEEENNLMPPGSFLPFVDQFKMMPKLDRWIVEKIIQWLSTQSSSSEVDQVFCLNVARDTLCDVHFPGFVQSKLEERNVRPGLLCFEVEKADAESNSTAAQKFSEKIRKIGSSVSLCGFSHNQSALDLLNKMKVDYLKIDGCLICNILNDNDDLEEVTKIRKLAASINAKTIAELVETDEVVNKLREIGIDYAQGFYIAKPFSLK